MAAERKEMAAKLVEAVKAEGGTATVVEAGTALMGTRVDGKLDFEAALSQLREEKGLPTPKKRGADGEADGGDGEEGDGKKKKKPRKKKEPPPPVGPDLNHDLCAAFKELAGYEFKAGNTFQGIAYNKVAKLLTEHDKKVESGTEAGALKGVGKASVAKIDEFLETGQITRLENYRNGIVEEKEEK